MPRASIDLKKCLKCEICLAEEVCPAKAVFRIDPDGPAIIEQGVCYGCGDCVEKCPGKAITFKRE